MSSPIPYTGLKEGEKLLWYGRRSLISYLRRIIIGAILIVLAVMSYIGFISLSILTRDIFLLIGIVLIIFAVVRARANMYYVTNIRILHEYRLFGRSIRETTLDKITDIVFNQGFFERLLNLGSVHFSTAGTGFLGIDFKGIKDPLVVRGLVINAKEEYFRVTKTNFKN